MHEIFDVKSFFPFSSLQKTKMAINILANDFNMKGQAISEGIIRQGSSRLWHLRKCSSEGIQGAVQ